MEDFVFLNKIDAVATTIGSETLLSLYPQLIRISKVSVEIQTFIRVVLIAACSYIVMNKNEGVRPTYWQGVVNTLHILSSYYAFQTINTGDALTLFYTYPIWNLLFSHILLKESMTLQQILYVIIGVIGAIFIAEPSFKDSKKFNGIIAALLAAVTESIMYITYHNPGPKTSVSQRIFQLYGGSVPFVSIVLVLRYFWVHHKKTEDFFQNVTLRNIGMIIAFNIFIGYTAHQGRAWGALRLSAPLFSSLSMIGIISGYFFSFIFEKKKPTKQIIFGACMILIASVLSFFEKDIMLLHEQRKKKKEEQKT
jgi:drug/metabolite transporter (DMT)-like permease